MYGNEGQPRNSFSFSNQHVRLSYFELNFRNYPLFTYRISEICGNLLIANITIVLRGKNVTEALIIILQEIEVNASKVNE